MARGPHVGSVEGARVHSAAAPVRRDLEQAYVDLYWLPLGAGSSSVRSSGHAFELVAAHRAERPRQPLHHSALKVCAGLDAAVLEMTPALRRPVDRGVVVVGPVGTPPRSRACCYEVRRWPAGEIGDVAAAVDSPAA